jgi:ribosomal protein S18 acetylase RimI-like enzyme
MLIRRLNSSDAEAHQVLRLQALQESPDAFGSSYEEECDIPIATIGSRLDAQNGLVKFGAFDGDHMVGLIGVGREGMRKLAHKAFICAMYVSPSHRNHKIGQALLMHAIEFARTMEGIRQLILTVNAKNEVAVRLYEAAGFKSFGMEPAGLLVDGVFYDELHMVCFL